MLNLHQRLLSLTFALATTAAFAGCTVESESNDDESPTLGGSGGTGGRTGGTGGTVTGGSGGGGTGGSATGGVETGGGTAGLGGEGGAPEECLQLADLDLDGDADPETGKPDCADLPYAEQRCAGADSAGLYLCRTAALTFEDGVFQALYSSLEDIDVADACSAEHDAAVAAVLAGDATQPGIRSSACENAKAAATCTALTAEGALADCEESLNVLNETGQSQVRKCMADGSLDDDPDYGPWQVRFERLCRTPAVPEAYSDTQGATRTCQELIELFEPLCENARTILLCQQFDNNWARGGFFDALVEELGYNPNPDACSAEHAAYADAVLADLRRAAAPSLTGGDVCDSIAGGCPTLSPDECRLHIDFLKSSTQESVLGCMAPVDESTCRETFLNDCAVD